MSADKIVTHDDLETLKDIRSIYSPGTRPRVLIDRLIAKAQADVPDLPTGWVLCDRGGTRAVAWHEAGTLTTVGLQESHVSMTVPTALSAGWTLTPLRTVTADPRTGQRNPWANRQEMAND